MIQLASTLYPAAPCWYPEGVAAETTVKSGETKQRKKRVDPFAQFCKVGYTGGGVRRTDDFRFAGKIKQRSKAAGGGIPREERFDITGDKGSGQEWMEEGGYIADRNMEECNKSRGRKR